MEGSAADDLKSLNTLINELATTLAASRDDESKIDELVGSIANDAGINYDEFKRHQHSKAKDYFRPASLNPVVVAKRVSDAATRLSGWSYPGAGLSVIEDKEEEEEEEEEQQQQQSGSDLQDQQSQTSQQPQREQQLDDVELDEVDREIQRYQADNLKLEQQIQRNEFLITKYLPLLDREEEIIKGLLDFLKEKDYTRASGEKILRRRYENQAGLIEARVADLKQRGAEQEKAFGKLESMWGSIAKVVLEDLKKKDKVNENYKTAAEDVKLLLENFRGQRLED